MAEKKVEIELGQYLENHFPKKYIFYDPNEHCVLKQIFASASKKHSGRRGIPDRLVFSGRVLVVIECKTSMPLCIRDIHTYKKYMVIPDGISVFFVAFVSRAHYTVYSENMMPTGKTLTMSNVGMLIASKNMNLAEMQKHIHEIHDYIRGFTKISDGDKPFFIACILIALKKSSFKKLVEQFVETETQNVFEMIERSLLDHKLDLNVFSFMRSDANNIHMYTIVKKVLRVLDENPSVDLLNLFYEEFVRYGNKDGASLGIVLTPFHLVELMTRLIDVKTGDRVLDICTGTGSFLVSAHNYGASQLVGCEYQSKLFSLLKCNFILRDIAIDQLYNGNCFEFAGKLPTCNKCLLNPPYGIVNKDEQVLDFAIFALEHVEIKGELAVILPISTLSDPSLKAKRREVTKRSALRKIIYCNKNLFVPSASVHCCVLVLQRERGGHDFAYDVVKVYDYENDGVVVSKNNGKIKTDEFDDRFAAALYGEPCQEFKITDGCEWTRRNTNKVDYAAVECELRRLEIVREYEERLRAIVPRDIVLAIKTYKIGDIVEVLRSGKLLNKNCSATGEFPVVTASKANNGVSCYTDTWIHEDCFTICKDGSVGFCFYHNYKFHTNSHVHVFRVKRALAAQECVVFALAMTQRFSNSIYNFGCALSKERFLGETIDLPEGDAGEFDMRKLFSV